MDFLTLLPILETGTDKREIRQLQDGTTAISWVNNDNETFSVTTNVQSQSRTYTGLSQIRLHVNENEIKFGLITDVQRGVVRIAYGAKISTITSFEIT